VCVIEGLIKHGGVCQVDPYVLLREREVRHCIVVSPIELSENPTVHLKSHRVEFLPSELDNFLEWG